MDLNRDELEGRMTDILQETYIEVGGAEYRLDNPQNHASAYLDTQTQWKEEQLPSPIQKLEDSDSIRLRQDGSLIDSDEWKDFYNTLEIVDVFSGEYRTKASDSNIVRTSVKENMYELLWHIVSDALNRTEDIHYPMYEHLAHACAKRRALRGPLRKLRAAEEGKTNYASVSEYIERLNSDEITLQDYYDAVSAAVDKLLTISIESEKPVDNPTNATGRGLELHIAPIEPEKRELKRGFRRAGNNTRDNRLNPTHRVEVCEQVFDTIINEQARKLVQRSYEIAVLDTIRENVGFDELGYTLRDRLVEGLNLDEESTTEEIIEAIGNGDDEIFRRLKVIFGLDPNVDNQKLIPVAAEFVSSLGLDEWQIEQGNKEE